MMEPRSADVCLVLEGTYPYASGGVSTWVHQIITSLPDLRFAVFYLGAESNGGLKPQYKIPDNVVSIETLFLFDELPGHEHTPKKTPAVIKGNLYSSIADFFTSLSSKDMPVKFKESIRIISQASDSFTFANLCQDREAWEIRRAAYQKHMPNESFFNFFWNARFLVQPLWHLVRACERIPRAAMYHSLCTGYAGTAAALAAEHYGSSYLLSEHGIYVKERLSEIQNAPWIHEAVLARPWILEELGSFRTLWFDFFKVLGRISYHYADRITSLFENNAALQIEFGAPEEKIEIIPNGVSLADFDTVIRNRTELIQADPLRKNVGFLGRIVKIKDVKNLLRAARIVLGRFPGAAFLLAGETEDDSEYYRECVELARHLHIAENINFMGLMNRDDVLAQTDVMLLTSISEGLPFVILESFAACVPVVATDVGSCRDLIEGKPGERPHCGSAGIVTPVGEPEQTAAALISLLEDTELRKTYGSNGRRRVEAFYQIQDVVRRYRELYTIQDFKYKIQD
jgi:glycosyltransferase involved in cell wall biosynthesis